MKKAGRILFIIVGIVFLIIMVLYARDGRLSLDTIKYDFLEAMQLNQARIEEKLNYNPVTYDELISKLQKRGYVIGDVEELGSNSLGAKIAVKFTVNGNYINFYIIDWTDETNTDILNTKELLDSEGKVFIDGRKYEAKVNDTALISRYEDNAEGIFIVEEFEKIIPIPYEDMVAAREKTNAAQTVTE